MGYQLGFQKITESGVTATAKTDFFHLGFGIGSYF